MFRTYNIVVVVTRVAEVALVARAAIAVATGWIKSFGLKHQHFSSVSSLPMHTISHYQLLVESTFPERVAIFQC